MTYLSQEWGIEKCNFFIYPDEKAHSVTTGLLLPNYNKKGGLNSKIKLNFADVQVPQGRFDNFRDFEATFEQRNADAGVPNMLLEHAAKDIWQMIHHGSQDNLFINNFDKQDEPNISDFAPNDDRTFGEAFELQLPVDYPKKLSDLTTVLLALNPGLPFDVAGQIARLILNHPEALNGSNNYNLVDHNHLPDNGYNNVSSGFRNKEIFSPFNSSSSDASFKEKSKISTSDDNYSNAMNILSSYFANLFSDVSDYTFDVLQGNKQPKDVKLAAKDAIYGLQIYLELRKKLPNLDDYLIDDSITSTALQFNEVMNSTNVSIFLQNKVFSQGQYFAAMMEMIFPLLIGKNKNIERTIQAIMHTYLKAPKCKLDENGFAKVK